ncbi:F-box domain protein [Trichostrongylus colubriformis]|uniref:F-box domain protein n=1 Tax=Trichostrongylus colubriformis TaxID=6319 RepID=A0AAN8FUR6_TRICO
MVAAISFANLPPEMTEKILENVDSDSIRAAQAVCRQWRNTINRRRHRMKRNRVQEIYISDDQDTAVTLTITHLSPSFESVSTVKIAEYGQLFDCLWIYAPKKLNISATRNELRTALEGIPDWWFLTVQMLGIYESACDLDALSLVSRAPHCVSLRIDPCFTIDSVTSLLDCMRQIHELKIRTTSKTITADDTTIDALIPLSIACPQGLQSFWVDSISTDFSLSKMFELLEKGHFSPRCSLLFEKVHGSESALRNWITSHAQQVLYISEQTYNFAYRDVEIGISVEQFVP